MRKVKEQPIREIYTRKKYWDDVAVSRGTNADGEFQESPRANPDSIDEGMSMYYVKKAEKEVTDRVKKLMKLANQILTQQQYNVFVLLAVKEPALTEREAAKALSITRGRVHQLWAVAREKLSTAYNTRTGDSK